MLYGNGELEVFSKLKRFHYVLTVICSAWGFLYCYLFGGVGI